MAVNQIKTRILNKIDSYSNWIAEGAIVLKKGEIGIATIETSDSLSGLTPPATGIKVGDGNTPFKDLPWVQAIAGDIDGTVKTHLASEAALKAFVESAASSDISDLNNAIDGLKTRMSAAEDNISSLQSSLSTLEGTVGGHTTSIGTLNTTVNSLSTNKADKTQVATDIANAKTELIGTVSDATTLSTINAAKNLATEAKGAADAASAKAQTGIDNAATAQAAAEAAQGTANTAKSTADSALSKANTNAGNITTIQGQIADINEALGGGTDGSSVNDRLTALETTNSQQNTEIANNADKIGAEKTRAEGVEAGLNTRLETIEVFFESADNSTDVVDTLKEIQNYIASDESGAATMASNIQKNTAAISTLESTHATDKTELQNYIDTVKSTIMGTGIYGTDNIGTVKAAAAAASTKADTNLETAKTYAAQQAATVLGDSADIATDNTVYGAKAAAAAASNAAATAQTTANNANTSATAANNLATSNQNNFDTLTKSFIAEADGAISTISFSENKITATRKKIDMDDMSDTATFVFYCGTANDVI